MVDDAAFFREIREIREVDGFKRFRFCGNRNKNRCCFPACSTDFLPIPSPGTVFLVLPVAALRFCNFSMKCLSAVGTGVRHLCFTDLGSSTAAAAGVWRFLLHGFIDDAGPVELTGEGMPVVLYFQFRQERSRFRPGIPASPLVRFQRNCAAGFVIHLNGDIRNVDHIAVGSGSTY